MRTYKPKDGGHSGQCVVWIAGLTSCATWRAPPNERVDGTILPECRTAIHASYLASVENCLAKVMSKGAYAYLISKPDLFFKMYGCRRLTNGVGGITNRKHDIHSLFTSLIN